MAIARMDDPIVCAEGHICGHLMIDVGDLDPINPEDFSIDLDAAPRVAANDGHVCAQCDNRVTWLRKGRYQVRTEQGWFGQF
jgi:hypothetical protein